MATRVSDTASLGTPRSHRRESALAGLLRRDPRRIVLHRAARITLASCVAFYTCRFLIGDAQMAVYACFAAISFGALSSIAGTTAQRLRLFAGALVASWILVAAGTWAAINVWVASAGMLLVGLLVSYLAIGGARVAGVSSGLLLMYILPSFPPYNPQALDSRLIGVALGTVLMAAADRWMWPPPDPPPYESRLAQAADALAEYLRRVRPLMDGASGSDGALAEARSAAQRAARACAPSALPPEQRPSSPFRQDRARAACAVMLRIVVSRTRAVEVALRRPDAPDGPRRGAFLLDAVADAVAASGAALAGAGPPPDPEPLWAANRRHADVRMSWLRACRADRHRVERATPVGQCICPSSESRPTCSSNRCGQCAVHPYRPRESSEDAVSWSSPLWFVGTSTTPAVVASRPGPPDAEFGSVPECASAGRRARPARYLAGRFDLSHGFWVLLATLTLMRTTAAATRSALWPAFLGTVAGALAAAGLLMRLASDLPSSPSCSPSCWSPRLPSAASLGPVRGAVLLHPRRRRTVHSGGAGRLATSGSTVARRCRGWCRRVDVGAARLAERRVGRIGPSGRAHIARCRRAHSHDRATCHRVASRLSGIDRMADAPRDLPR